MTKLTTTESSKLSLLESTIESGRKAFESVGLALTVIRDGKLYRETHETFEAYCLGKWGWERTKAYRLMDAADVSGNLLPIGNKPSSESQARPLAKLETPAQQQAAWDLAGDIAAEEEKPITANHVERAAKAVSEAVKESKPPVAGVIPPPPKKPADIKQAAKKHVPEPESHRDHSEETDLARELEDCHNENLRLQTLVESLSATDSGKEIKAWKGKYDAVNGRLNQTLVTESEMKKTLQYQSGLLTKIRKTLGVEKNGDILEAIKSHML